MKEELFKKHLEGILQEQQKKYPADQKQAPIKAILMAAQEEKGFLSKETLELVATVMGLSLADVYEVATFYSLFHLEPVGQYKIDICTNVSCWLRGASDLIKEAEKALNIQRGQTTSDRLFTLREVECLAACSQAPALQINGAYQNSMTKEELLDWIAEKRKEHDCPR